MLIGYNNDVQYRGKTFHIQTEDRGAPSHQIETQIFHSGAILDTRIISYEEKLADITDRTTRNKSIKQLMQTTHRELYKNLLSGKYDEFAGLEPKNTEEEDEVDDVVEDFTPSQERVPQAALELEEKGADAFEFQEGGDHVDISSLKSRLAAMGSNDSGDEESEEIEDDDLQTQVVANLDEMPRIVQNDAAKSSEGLPNKPILSFSNTSSGTGVHKSLAPPKIAPAFKKTGAEAWNGCLPAEEDLSLIALVESFLANA